MLGKSIFTMLCAFCSLSFCNDAPPIRSKRLTRHHENKGFLANVACDRCGELMPFNMVADHEKKTGHKIYWIVTN